MVVSSALGGGFLQQESGKIAVNLEPFKNTVNLSPIYIPFATGGFLDPLLILLLELERDTACCSWVEAGPSAFVAGDIVGAVAPVDLLFPILVTLFRVFCIYCCKKFCLKWRERGEFIGKVGENAQCEASANPEIGRDWGSDEHLNNS